MKLNNHLEQDICSYIDLEKPYYSLTPFFVDGERKSKEDKQFTSQQARW